MEQHSITSGSPKPQLRFTSSLSLKNEDVDQQLLLSTSVPIKIGNDNNKKESRKCNNRIRYTFGLRAVKATTADSNHKSSDNAQQQPQPQQSQPEQEHQQPKSQLVDNLSKNNSKLVKQTTIDYYV